MAWKPDYVTLVEQKNYMHIPDTVDDLELPLDITTASRAVDYHCNRQFGLATQAQQRLYTPWYDWEEGCWVVDVEDFMTTVGLIVIITGIGTVPTTDYVKEPVNAAADGMPWTRLRFIAAPSVRPTGARNELDMTVQWGWTAVPVPVKEATRLQTSRFAARRDSPYGVAGSPDLGNELRLLARLDPDVAVSLKGFVRPRRAG